MYYIIGYNLKQIIDENQKQSRELQEAYTTLRKVKQAYDDAQSALNEARENMQKAQRSPNAKERELDKVMIQINLMKLTHIIIIAVETKTTAGFGEIPNSRFEFERIWREFQARSKHILQTITPSNAG